MDISSGQILLLIFKHSYILASSATMAGVNDVAVSSVSMPSTMPTESANGAHPKLDAEPILSLGSQSNLLSHLPPELALYVSRTDDTILRLNRYAPTSST